MLISTTAIEKMQNKLKIIEKKLQASLISNKVQAEIIDFIQAQASDVERLQAEITRLLNVKNDEHFDKLYANFVELEDKKWISMI